MDDKEARQNAEEWLSTSRPRSESYASQCEARKIINALLDYWPHEPAATDIWRACGCADPDNCEHVFRKDGPMGEWIVIIATVVSSYNNLIYVNTYTSNLGGLNGTISAPPSPTITVVRAKTREEAEAQALGYYIGSGGFSMWIDDKIVVPGLANLTVSRSAVVIAPDGKVYNVARSEKKKKVTKVVEESDGWETKWEPRP